MTPEQWLKAESLLSPKELEAVKRLSSAPAHKLSPAAAVHFFGLFLQNYTCEEIAKQNPGLGTLALPLICRARIEYDWDVEKEKYIKNLMDSTKATVSKTTLESVQFASDGMAVFHKMAGDCFRRYLQTGNQEELGEFKGMSFKTYKDLVRLFIALTDKKGQPSTGTDFPVDTTPFGALPMESNDEKEEASDPASILKMLTNVKYPAGS